MAKNNKNAKQKQKQNNKKQRKQQPKPGMRYTKPVMAARQHVNNQIMAALSPNNVCRAITLPHETKPIRFPVAGQSRKTALLKLRGEGTATMTIGGANQAYVMLIPSPIHPVWTNARFTATTGLHNVIYQLNGPRFYAVGWTSLGQWAVAPGFVGSETNPEYLTYIPPSTGGTSTISGLGWAGVTSLEVTFETGRTLGDESLLPVGPITVTGGAWSVVAGGFGASWTRPSSYRVLAGTLTGTAMSLTITAQAPANTDILLPAFAALEVSTLNAVNLETRVNACSLLMTNTTPEVSRCGVIDASTLEYRRTNIFDTSAVYSQVTSRNADLRYNGPGEKGMYCYALPTPESESFDDYTTILSNFTASGVTYEGSIVPSFRLDDAARASVAVYTGSQALSVVNGTVAQTFVLLYDEHREFVTTSQIYPLGNSVMMLQTYQTAVTAASSIVPFTENPLHWSLLGSLLYKGLQLAAPYLKPLARKGVKYVSDRALEYLS